MWRYPHKSKLPISADFVSLKQKSEVKSTCLIGLFMASRVPHQYSCFPFSFDSGFPADHFSLGEIEGWLQLKSKLPNILRAEEQNSDKIFQSLSTHFI
ncbi:MAG: hypothetical protein ACM3PY_01665 [Omnitrophica WOR_2 bacterium]